MGTRSILGATSSRGALAVRDEQVIRAVSASRHADSCRSDGDLIAAAFPTSVMTRTTATAQRRRRSRPLGPRTLLPVHLTVDSRLRYPVRSKVRLSSRRARRPSAHPYPRHVTEREREDGRDISVCSGSRTPFPDCPHTAGSPRRFAASPLSSIGPPAGSRHWTRRAPRTRSRDGPRCADTEASLLSAAGSSLHDASRCPPSTRQARFHRDAT